MKLLLPFLAQHALAGLVTLGGTFALLFVAVRLVPGDLASVQLGTRATPELRAEFTARMGLDQPLWTQFWLFFRNALSGDFGTDVVTGRPILDLILEVLPNTLQLAFAAMAIAVVASTALGCLAALRPGSRLDSLLGGTSVAFISTPAFVIAILLLIVFSVQLKWLPVSGAGAAGDLGDRLSHLILPAIALSLGWIGYLARLLRGSLLEVLSEQHVQLMRAYGVGEARIVGRFALRLALVPTVSVLGIGIGDMISNAVFVEIIFARPGIGTLVFNALQDRNYPVVQAAVMLTATIYVLASLGVELVNALLDPRVARGLGERA